MALKNPWVGYITRSYDQIRDTVITRLQSLVPEITDHTESNIFVKIISIWSGIAEMLGYYIDNKGRETFLPTAQEFASAVKIARTFGYRVKAWRSASTTITFTLNQEPSASDSPVEIPAGTEVQTPQGVRFFTTEAAKVFKSSTPGEKNLEGKALAKQEVEQENIFIGSTDGSENQRFPIQGNVVDAAQTLSIGGVTYTFIEDFTFAKGTDEVFSSGINEDGVFYIILGNGVNGKIPTPNQNVLCTYRTTLGADGNSGTNTVTELQGAPILSDPYEIDSVTNKVRATGGGFRDTLKDLKKRIPISFRTQGEAVTRFDYENLALMVAGVSQAAVGFDCGKVVDVYVATTGGTASPTLLQAVKDYYDDDRRMVTTLVEAKASGTLEVIIEATINAQQTEFNSQVKQRVLDKLTTEISAENKDIREPLFLGDVYAFIENTPGVRNSRITKFTLRPEAIELFGGTALVWDRTLRQETEQTKTWQIKMLDSTNFRLVEGSSTRGSFQVGVTVTLPEIEFTVQPNGYQQGDEWEFKTYPTTGDIIPDEFSVVTAFESNLNLEVTGGI